MASAMNWPRRHSLRRQVVWSSSTFDMPTSSAAKASNGPRHDSICAWRSGSCSVVLVRWIGAPW